jgi:hypothetical protein
LDWKSKVYTTQKYLNFGAARVIADYFSDPEQEIAINEANDLIVADNLARILAADYTGGALGTVMANEFQVAASGLTPLIESNFSCTFQFFVNKRLIFSTTRTNSEPFRLPTGYRADTFEVRVATTARIRSIHLAESMAGLRGV